MSRWPFAEPPMVTDVSYQEREPRRAIAARILSDQGEVKVIATHLGLSIHERHAQAHALAELVQPTRTLVLGDFNDWFWVKSVRGVLARICPVRTRLRTFPARLPLMRLDRIYASRDLHDPLGLDRPQGARLFGPSARDRRRRAAGVAGLTGPSATPRDRACVRFRSGPPAPRGGHFAGGDEPPPSRSRRLPASGSLQPAGRIAGFPN